MRFFGFEITRPSRELTVKAPPGLSMVPTARGRGWTTIFEPFAGAWQRNIKLDLVNVTSNHAVFACMTLIAGDVSKLGSPEFKRKVGEIWKEDDSSAYDPVLREPNQFQTPNQFWENWILSKLWKGNTYVLKGRDDRNVVRRMWILDPCAVTVLLSTGGDVFYQLDQDNLSGVATSTVVPASEIIHDRMNCLFSPLIGISPLYAAGLAATLGLNIQTNAATFFANRSLPGGIITTPNTIPQETAERLKREWENRYGPEGDNTGKTAVLGDGLEFKPMAVTATDSQMLEMAKVTAEWVCSVFHVPLYMIGAGPVPVSNNVEALNLWYYSQAIQKQLEDIEACLMRGLEMKSGTKVEFCTDGLIRMDTISQATTVDVLSKAGIISPNEGRARFDLPPVEGGKSPYLQQQNFSLEALAKRDAQDDPFKTQAPPTPAQPTPPSGDPTNDNSGGDNQRDIIPSIKDILRKARAHERRAA